MLLLMMVISQPKILTNLIRLEVKALQRRWLWKLSHWLFHIKVNLGQFGSLLGLLWAQWGQLGAQISLLGVKWANLGLKLAHLGLNWAPMDQNRAQMDQL